MSQELAENIDDPLVMIGRFDLTNLPLENQVNILWYCDEQTLINIAQTNRGFHHLILGEENDSDEVNAYRNTIWKVRLLSELNRLIDEYNKNVIDNVIDTSLVHNLNENDLDKYVRNNLRIREDRIRYSKILSKFKRLDYKADRSLPEGVSTKGRVLNNTSVYTWYSFLHRNYQISNDENYIDYCTFEGYEIVVNRYQASGGNDWNIVFGIGGDYEDFGKSNSIAEFTGENCGIGYILNCNQFKIKGEHLYEDLQQFSKDIKSVKVGDRFTIKIDRERKCIHYFKNGQHLVSIAGEHEDILSPIVYYPTISMCIEMSVIFYPLLQVDYPIKETESVSRRNLKFIF